MAFSTFQYSQDKTKLSAFPISFVFTPGHCVNFSALTLIYMGGGGGGKVNFPPRQFFATAQRQLPLDC